jgi:hypothetical protein
LLKRRAAGRVGGRAPKFCGHIFCTKNRIRAGFNTSAESGYSSNGIAALAVELETSPEQNGFGRTASTSQEWLLACQAPIRWRSLSVTCNLFAQVRWEETRMFPAFAETNSGGRLFYWNLDGSVGLRGANRFDDVMFVQWCLYKAAKWDGLDRVAKATAENIKGPSIREALAKTNVNGSCTGLQTDNLVEKITFLQSLISVDMDGRVDPMLNSARYTTSIGSKDVYLIMRLNQILKEVHPREYPRLDLMPEFVWRISDKVKPVFWN